MFLPVLGCKENHVDGQKQNVVKKQLPQPIANEKMLKKTLSDERVRRYIYPQRIVWQTPNTPQAEITGAEKLISSFAKQIMLNQSSSCELVNKGKAPGILLDFGKELHGGVQIMIGRMQSQQPVRLRVRFGESASEAMSDIGDGHNATNDHAVRDQTILAPWLGTVETGNTGFRFVRIDLLDENRAVPVIGVRAVFLYRDLEYKGSFRCSDERLNKIWETGAYTVHLCMQDYLWDGIKRDRLVWIGDMHPETMTVMTVFGKHGIVPASLDLIKTNTPLPGWMNGISSYSMWWLIIQYDWYLYQGDISYLRKQKKYILGLLNQLMQYIGRNNSEKLPETRFLDWPSNAQPKAINAGLHALLVLALDHGAKICMALDDESCAKKCELAVQRLKQYVPDAGQSKQAAALMALAGLASPQKLNENVMAVDGAHGLSTFYGYYVLKARALAGDYQGCLDIIRSYWGGMLDMGATTFWEDFDLAWMNNSCGIDRLPGPGENDIHGDFGNYSYKGFRHSLCHGWASGPTAWLSEYVLGIKPLEPGFRVVAIEPHLADLQWVEGTFPTPMGVIKVRHERNSKGVVVSTIEVPEGVRVKRKQ
ncbi:MAG: alpha-L-rhamnosidase [Actinobacteria bacterium]|nr:alpha-L-rhamnosidase [Actinomycetota bacterium]